MFLGQQDFTGSFDITQNALDKDDLDEVIDDTERDILKKALGYDEYHKLNTYVADGQSPVVTKYKELIEGAEFTVTDFEGRELTFKWEGLKNMLKGFCYYAILQKQKSINTGAGESNILTTNTQKAPTTGLNKAMTAFNKSVDIYGYVTNEGNSLNKYPVKSLSLHESYGCMRIDRTDKNYWKKKLTNSLYNYIVANEDSFPNWYFDQIKRINIFDI